MTKILLSDPADILKMTKEELVTLYVASLAPYEELENQMSTIKELLFDKIKGNGEVIGSHAITKAKRVNFDVTIEKAKELGAIKEAIDTKVLKDLYDKGIEVPHNVTEYLIIKEIKDKNVDA